MKWLAAILKERERTVRDALEGNARTARFIAILLTRLVIASVVVLLAIIGYAIWHLL
ncbi:hypothetical protein [Streptomyces sp. NPDC002685]|uniref:hypothetical protein n=1 Tax=Streptomyces sp. NPDC002685 TaxID=3154540 RepID=UPI003330575E